MSRCRRYALAVMLVVGAVDVGVRADEPVLSGKIVEAYSPSVNVGSATGALVGLWLGLPPKSVDVREIRVAVPAAPQLQKMCFSAVTRDGEYSARGVLSAANGASGALPVVTLRDSQYAEELSRYEGADLAVNVRLGKDCAIKPTAPYLPAVGGGDRSQLMVAINSRAISVSAELTAGVDVIKGECVPNLPGRSRAFDTRCTFALPDVVGNPNWTLALTRLPRAGARRIDDFEIWIQR